MAAAKKPEGPKMVLERQYTVPLRKEYMKAPRWRRTKKAVAALKQFVEKHMKSENVVLDPYVNNKLWEHGIKNPPHHIDITAKKDDAGRVTVSVVKLTGAQKRAQDDLAKRKQAVEDKAKSALEQAKAASDAKKADAKPADKTVEVKPAKVEDAKPAEKKADTTPAAAKEAKPAEGKPAAKPESKPAEKKEAPQAEAKADAKPQGQPEKKE